MGKNNIPKPKTLTPVFQAALVCSHYKNFSYKIPAINSVTIIGYLRPSLVHRTYKVEINYTLGKFPKIKIISPNINKNAPHTFQDNSLCTFYPDSNIWNRRMKMTETIVPWIVDWIIHYEIWEITGKWNGDADPRHPRGLMYAS